MTRVRVRGHGVRLLGSVTTLRHIAHIYRAIRITLTERSCKIAKMFILVLTFNEFADKLIERQVGLSAP